MRFGRLNASVILNACLGTFMDEAITHLLIVEDDHSVATAIAHWARRRGFTAELALNLEECRRALYEGSFDLVFIDLRLPNGVDGLDLAADLIAENPERPVVLMTAYAQLESAQRAVGVGIFEYLEKPIEFEQFSDVVDRGDRASAATDSQSKPAFEGSRAGQ